MSWVTFSLLTKAGVAIAMASALTVGLIGGYAAHSAVPTPTYNGPQSTGPQVLLQPTAGGNCAWKDDPLAGVDAGDAASLSLLNACGDVRGTVTAVVIAVEGEHTSYHFLLAPDAGFATMVNAQNEAQQGGALVIEVLPGDAAVMPRLHVNQHLDVEGPLVTDMDHGWNEIHPAKVIAEI